MADKVISASLKVDTGTSAKDIGDVNKALDNTSKELGDVEKDSKQTTGSFTNLKSSLGQIPGPLGAVNQGVNTVSTSLKALAANPIVLVVTLLVAALVALYKAFASTEAGAEKIEQIFAGLGAIVTVIRDRILALAGAVISFFKGDFKEAIEQTKAAVTGVGDAIVKAYSEAADATRELQEAQDELNRDLLVSRAKLNRDLAKTKELISDENASYADRKKAIEEVSKAEDEQTQKELANANKTLAALERKLALDAQNAELVDEVAKQRAKVYDIEREQAQNQRTFNKQNAALDKEQRAEAAEQQKKIDEDKKQRQQEEIAREKELEKIRQNRIKMGTAIITQEEAQKSAEDLALQRKKEQEEEQKKIDEERFTRQSGIMKEHTNLLYQSVKDEDTAVKAKISIGTRLIAFQQEVLAVASNLFGSLSNLLGKQTAAGKAFAIAQTTIDTYQSAIAAYKSLAGIPVIGPALGFAAAAAAIANGVSAVRSIMSTKVPGGGDAGSGGGVTNPLTAAAPIAPQQVGTSIDQDSIRGIGSAAFGRTYVLAQDVTRDQDRNERLNRAARLGG